jgi:tRNA(Ile)-lysidine synthase
MRQRSIAVGTDVRLIRPMLSWRRVELEQVCTQTGLAPASDPTNEDEQFERVRFRRGLSQANWLDAAAIARSAANLAEAETALDWAMRLEWKQGAREKGDAIDYRPNGAPPEILRRIAARAVRKLATEGDLDLRGGELDHLLSILKDGGTATLRGVLCSGGAAWRFSAAPRRRHKA